MVSNLPRPFLVLQGSRGNMVSNLKFGDGQNLCRVKPVWVDPRQFLRLFLSQRLKTNLTPSYPSIT